MKIAAALIAGDGVKPTDFRRCLQSLKGRVDGVFIAYNGEESQGLPDDLDFGVWERKCKWEDDFAKARNQSLDMVRELGGEDFDWVLWIDTDDTLEGGSLYELIADLDPATQGVFLRYDYSVDPATQAVLAVQWRERLLRLDGNWKWHYPIHEVCHAPAGTQFARKGSAWIKHWRKIDDTHEETRIRNRRILTKAMKEWPDEPRFKYYFANEVYAEAADAYRKGQPALELLNAAIHAYEEFVPQAPSPDDAYIALHQVGECRRMAKDYEGSIEAELQALMIHPSWSDAYVGIAQSYMEIQDWDKCRHWAQACLKNASEADTTQVREPLNDEYLPKILIGMSHEAYDELDEALTIYEELAQSGLATSELQGKITKLLTKMEARSTVPENIFSDDGSNQIEDNRPSICFFNRPLFEPWHSEIIKQGGMGGTEICVTEIASRFARDGWRTVIYGTPGEYEGFDENTGIEWIDVNNWRPTEEWDIFVSSRSPEVFDHNIKADITALWMHDVNVGEALDGPWGERITAAQPDFVIGLSQWHVNHLQRLYGISPQKLIEIPNGINLERFDHPEIERQPYKFAWSSSPDRGLDVLLQLWPQIRESHPEATLEIFYGWHTIDKIIEAIPNHPLVIFKEDIEGMLDYLGHEKAGITWHDRINQDELAKHLCSCDIWAYPTYFMETFCITAVEMQAAGVIPVASNLGALTERIALKNSLVDGWPNNESYQKAFLGALEGVSTLPLALKDRAREEGKEFAAQYSWDDAYQIWKQKLGVKELARA